MKRGGLEAESEWIEEKRKGAKKEVLAVRSGPFITFCFLFFYSSCWAQTGGLPLFCGGAKLDPTLRQGE